MHQLVSRIQRSTHNIYIKAYVVGTSLKCINLSVQFKCTHNIYIKVYDVVTHLNCINLSVQFKWVPPTYIKHMLLVPIWNASTCQCNLNEFPQHIYKSVCCWYPFEMHQLVNAIQRSTHNIYIKAYVVGTHLKCINLSVQFKWVPTTYI